MCLPLLTRADPPAAATAAGPTCANTAATATPVSATTNFADDVQGAHLKQLQKQLRAMGYTPRMRNSELMYCRREVPIGSHLASVNSCLSAADAERIAEHERDSTEAMQRLSNDCFTGGRCGADPPGMAGGSVR
jgi:hypothetical protein